MEKFESPTELMDTQEVELEKLKKSEEEDQEVASAVTEDVKDLRLNEPGHEEAKQDEAESLKCEIRKRTTGPTKHTDKFESK